MTPNEHIKKKTRGEIEAYIAGRGKTNVYEGARNLSQSISDDYGDRFLIELIQNAHDAHPVGRDDGEISIVLAPDEGAHGCLYVANRGRGFNAKNFKSLTNIALSNKPVNEDIGNKGLGFRSVLQICEWPEIYSAVHTGTKHTFDGYCFRFATQDDLVPILAPMRRSALAHEIWHSMPPWFLPVVAADRPGLVDRFSEQGFATVIRMPVESEEAKSAVIQQIELLLALETPLTLFLDRVKRINIQRRPDAEEVLERKCAEKWRRPSGTEIQLLEIGSDKYLMASADLEPQGFHQALNESLAKKEIPARWKDWRGDARVSVAVRLNRPVERGLFYCFLPLGHEGGAAPFFGYINANFYTKINRESVDTSKRLHRYFISSAARLCRDAIDFLIEKKWPESPSAVVDLLCWQDTQAANIRRAFDCDEAKIVKKPILPAWNGVQAKWTAAEDTFIWEVAPTSCLSVEAVTRSSSAAILLPTLTPSQVGAIRDFFVQVNEYFYPTEETIAGWVESVAQSMIKEPIKPDVWASFYDEVASHLRSNPSVLFGREFLLSSSNSLLSSQPDEYRGRQRAADIYFPPVRTGDGDDDSDEPLPLEVFPASLKRRFQFLSKDVPWLNDDGGYRPARAFFLQAKLVREYDTREALRTLAAVTRDDVADSTKDRALEWAFRLWSSGRSLSDKETRGVRFSLPTAGGWTAAEETMFGSGWTTQNGRALEKLLRVAGNFSAELDRAKDRLLLAYKEWPISYGTEEQWSKFLRAAGVRDCLRPIGGDKRLQKDALYGRYLGHEICGSIGIDEVLLALWEVELSARAEQLRNPNTPYRAEVFPWRLGGLGDSLTFADSTLRRDYAYQILQAIPHLEKEHLSFRVYRPPERYGQHSNEERWPTPLAVFISNSPWLPVQRASGEARFVPPSDAWLSSLDFDPRPPRFIDLVSASLARTCEDGLTWLRANAGLGLLDDPRDADRAIEVYTEAAKNTLSEDTDVRRFSELFSGALNAVIEGDRQADLESIPVWVGDHIEAIPLHRDDQEAEKIYFADEDNDLKTQILAELLEPIFDFHITDVENTWKFLEKLAPGRFLRVSEQPLDVFVDGARFEPGQQTPLLRDVFGGWITDFLVCAAEAKGGSFFTRSQKTLSRLRHAAELLQFVVGSSVQINMGGALKELPLASHGAVVLRTALLTTLIVESPDGDSSLDLLAHVAEQLAIAVNQKPLANGFEAALLRLARLQSDNQSTPADDDIAEALGVDVDELSRTRRYAQSDLSSHMRFALPLAAYLGLTATIDLLTTLSSEENVGESIVLEALRPLAIAIEISESELLRRLGLVSDIRELKEILNLDLPRINSALRSLGLPGISNKESHQRQFNAFLMRNNADVIGRIRAAFIVDFDKFQSLAQYVQFRNSMQTIEADPIWFETYDQLPDEIMEDQINRWFLTHGLSGSPSLNDLPTVAEIRETNVRTLRAFGKRYSAFVSAQLRSQDTLRQSLREIWLEHDDSYQAMLKHAHEVGWLDFRALDDEKIVKWLELSRLWPEGKPPSLDPRDWGLPTDVIEQAQQDSERERETRRQERTQITFAGRKVSALQADYQALMDVVNANIGHATALLNIDAALRPLLDAPEGGQEKNRGGGGSRGRKSPEANLSEDQRAAIGFLGERWAFEWIKNFHQKTHSLQLDDSCWVSGNRNTVMADMTGRDDLGFDFKVQLSSTTYYYEVKASIGNPQFFEIGPTEIAAASRYKADRDNKFRILYVAYVGDPERVEFSVLANPFSREGRSKFRLVGRGSVKYEFVPAD